MTKVFALEFMLTTRRIWR